MWTLGTIKNSGFLLLLLALSCGEKQEGEVPADSGSGEAALAETKTQPEEYPWVSGAERTSEYLPLLKGKRVGLVANQTSQVRSATGQWVHLVDTLLSSGISISRVFSPEHGFRGSADAGEKVESGRDARTGLAIVSLYGRQRKPDQEQLSDLDLIVFDIQDVGVRFYTYIATLQLVMEAASEAGKPVIVLDRPNPNGHYVDGPTMEDEHTGFLGMNTIPLVYGLTIGEYARMVQSEGWMKGAESLDLTVIELENYRHQDRVYLPFPPSPNLPNARSIALYPSLGLFEGTYVNAGRGTKAPFQQFGASFLEPTVFTYSYVPRPMPGAKYPKEEGRRCWGTDLRDYPWKEIRRVELKWLIQAYNARKTGGSFFKRGSFEKHSGTSYLQDWIESGKSESEIRGRWKPELAAYREIRAKYLTYP